MALVLSIAYQKLFIMAYLAIYGLRIFVFFINSLFTIVLYVYCSSTHALPINIILSNLECFILWFSRSKLFVYGGFNLILIFSLILIIVFSTLNFMYLLLSVCWMLTKFCILLMDVLNAE
jgi:hypothetical protein